MKKWFILIMPFLMLAGCTQQVQKNMNVNLIVERYDTVQQDYVPFMTFKEQQQISDGLTLLHELAWTTTTPPNTTPNYRFYIVAEDLSVTDIKAVMYEVWFDDLTATAILANDSRKETVYLDHAKVNEIYDLLMNSAK